MGFFILDPAVVRSAATYYNFFVLNFRSVLGLKNFRGDYVMLAQAGSKLGLDWLQSGVSFEFVSIGVSF